MIAFLALAFASAAEPDLVAAGKPFSPASVIAIPDPGHPGMLAITATSKAVTCAQVAKKKADFGIALLVTVEAASGAVVGGMYVGEKFWVPMLGGGEAGDVPAAAKTGTVTVDLVNEDSHAKGTLTYTLCTALPAAPPLTITADRGQLALEDLTIEVDRPSGWVASTDPNLGRSVWKAPDGYTSLSLYSTCGGDCVAPTAERAKSLADDQAKAFEGVPPWTLKVLDNSSPTPGSHVLRYELGQPGLGSTITLQVWRWAEGWSHFVVCEGVTVPWRAAALDSLQQACMGVTSSAAVE